MFTAGPRRLAVVRDRGRVHHDLQRRVRAARAGVSGRAWHRGLLPKFCQHHRCGARCSRPLAPRPPPCPRLGCCGARRRPRTMVPPSGGRWRSSRGTSIGSGSRGLASSRCCGSSVPQHVSDAPPATCHPPRARPRPQERGDAPGVRRAALLPTPRRGGLGRAAVPSCREPLAAAPPRSAGPAPAPRPPRARLSRASSGSGQGSRASRASSR